MMLPTEAKAIEERKWFLELPQLHICLNFCRPINLSSNLGRSPTCPSSRSNTCSNLSQFSTITSCKFCNKLGGNNFNSDVQFFNLRDQRLPPKESRRWPSLISCNIRSSESVIYNIDVLHCIHKIAAINIEWKQTHDDNLPLDWIIHWLSIIYCLKLDFRLN